MKLTKHTVGMSLQRCLTVILVLQLIFFSVGLARTNHGQQRVKPGNRSRKVRLVLGIVIDQFRYDYLTRFKDLFGAGGFRFLIRDGAVFTNANYPYVPTITAPGHATFMSGSVPALHGIIGNEWFERETGRTVTSIFDPNVKLLGGQGAEPASPSRLVGSTVGDQLRLATNGRSKVVGIAFKDRAAILPAGKHPNGAYWFDLTNGAFVSSTYYFPDLPDWVKHFNQNHPSDRYFGARWDRLLSAVAYQRSLPDDSPYEKPLKGSNKFPHIINGGETKPGNAFYDNLAESPFANEQTDAFAKAAIDSEQLGQDDYPDLLTVSFSANDRVGHTFGPYSQEVEDITLRTDRILADLFSFVDKRVGLANTVIVLTADHGVAPIPEHSRDIGLGGGRIEDKAITDAVETALVKRYGGGKWIRALVNGNIYFDYDVIEQHSTKRQEVAQIGCDAILKLQGVAECFPRTQLLSGTLAQRPLSGQAANGFYAERSGDLIIVLKPFFVRPISGTSHSTPYSYDTHVPVIFYGPGVIAGSYSNSISPSDIAPTLSTLLKIEPPSNTVGRVLTEAIKVEIAR